jgi:uncharacterized membrane protein YedE/YeeE
MSGTDKTDMTDALHKPHDTCPLACGLMSRPRWNPYLVGVAIGVLCWIVFAIVNKPLGMSTSISAASGACAIPLVGEQSVMSNAYWAKTSPKWDYGMLFLVGTFGGALFSSLISRSFKFETVPSVWAERFGPSKAKRLIWAFLGGVLILYGARMADGCTSGHGISGTLQLALSSWTFFLTMFASGVITAWLMFRSGKTA